MAKDWTLPAILLNDPSVGAGRLASYFADRLSDGQTPFYSGAMFERLGRGGDAPDVQNVITPEDWWRCRCSE